MREEDEQMRYTDSSASGSKIRSAGQGSVAGASMSAQSSTHSRYQAEVALTLIQHSLRGREVLSRFPQQTAVVVQHIDVAGASPQGFLQEILCSRLLVA